MALAPHPLPSVIGRTERALTALLLETLRGSGVRDNDEWVALNVAAGGPDDVPAAVRSVLRVPPGRVTQALAALADGGLLDADGRTTAAGRELLDGLRARTAPVTHHVVEGLDDEDVATAVRVLDAVRERAVDALSSTRRVSPAGRA